MSRRPKLTPKRVRGLKLMAERARPVIKGKAGTLFGPVKAEAGDLRAALQYIEELVAWHNQPPQPNRQKGASPFPRQKS